MMRKIANQRFWDRALLAVALFLASSEALAHPAAPGHQHGGLTGSVGWEFAFLALLLIFVLRLSSYSVSLLRRFSYRFRR